MQNKDLFKEIIPSILENKEYQLTNEEDEKVYSGFMVNKSLSAHIDTILYANEMNRRHFLDKKLQYDYLFHSIRKYKRKYQKWIKYNESKDIQLIKEYYSYSTKQAEQVFPLLSKSDLEYITEKLDKGGRFKNNK
jgi:hypothetical protein